MGRVALRGVSRSLLSRHPVLRSPFSVLCVPHKCSASVSRERIWVTGLRKLRIKIDPPPINMGKWVHEDDLGASRRPVPEVEGPRGPARGEPQGLHHGGPPRAPSPAPKRGNGAVCASCLARHVRLG